MEICHRCQQLKDSYESIGFSILKFGKKATYKFHLCKECVEEMKQEVNKTTPIKQEKIV